MTMQKEKAVSIRGPEHSTLFWAFGTVCIYIYIYLISRQEKETSSGRF